MVHGSGLWAIVGNIKVLYSHSCAQHPQQESSWFPLISNFCKQTIYSVGNYQCTSMWVSKRMSNKDQGVCSREGFQGDVHIGNWRCANKEISISMSTHSTTI